MSIRTLLQSRFGLSLAIVALGGLVAARHLAPTGRSTEPTRTVLDFGARGDGKTDDTEAIQRAVDARIGTVCFPRGTYRITRTIEIRLDRVGPTSLVGDGTARIVMAGPGPAFRFVGTHEGTADPRTVKAQVWQHERAPMVTGLEIVGAHPESHGIEAQGTMQMIVSRVAIRDVHHAIHLVKRDRNVIIESCQIYDNRGAGIYYDHVNLHQSNIVGCHISYNDEGGIVVRGGEGRNIHIGTCDIEGNMGGPGLKPAANVWLDAPSGSIGEVAIVGCTIQHEEKAPHSANIRIDLHSQPRRHTEERRHGNVTIADNILSDVQTNIDVRRARAVTITGNTIWQGYSHNLRIEDCETIVVSNNVFDRNPRYAYKHLATNAIVIERCRGVTFAGNQVVGVAHVPAAMVVRSSEAVMISDCRFADCRPIGLLLEDVGRSRVAGCTFLSGPRAREEQVSLRIDRGRDILVNGNLWDVPPQTDGHGIRVSNNLSLRP